MFLTEQFEMTSPIGLLGSMGVYYSHPRSSLSFFVFITATAKGAAQQMDIYSFAIAFGA